MKLQSLGCPWCWCMSVICMRRLVCWTTH